ncbi:hypothetical protein ACH5RR_035290 [Cinchona calisaya]|uniref:High mobility group B protein 9 n=1 Tax=Cinchona calisaya TaxID=153742 RepID=A0ABD2YHF0_9GENT
MCSTTSKAIVPFKNGVENEGSSKQYYYPSALASHEEVIKNPSLFWDTLRIFHKTMGRKHMVPVIGGKELNLHVLYAEVTRRGGFDKVVIKKKWKEVSSVFEFAPTTTSASYALRKHYFSLLYHYEQVYFFRLKGPMLESPPGPLCFQAVGTIDGKFDCGYLVSVKLGSEILNGVLYHPGHSSSSSTVIKPSTAIVPYTTPQPHRSGRRKRKRRGGDPGRPKPNRSGYNFFFAEKHSMLKSLYPNREREFTKMIGESWNNLTPEERTVYQDYGMKDKERYQREMKEYKERMNIMPCSR